MKNVLSLIFQEVLPDDERRDHNCEIDVYAKQGWIWINWRLIVKLC